MKNLIILFGLIAISSMWSCKTTKSPVVVNTPEVPEVPEAPEVPDVLEAPVVAAGPPEVEETVGDVPVQMDVVVAEDAVEDMVVAASVAISTFVYYTIEDVNGRDKFVEQSVEGDGTFSTVEGENRLTIVEDGTNKQINCKQMMHPQLKTDVYVEIGDDTEDRAH